MVTTQEFLGSLQHHGVKGMKWGVRNDRGHVGERVKTKKLAKLDKKWQKNIYSIHGAIAIHNKTADIINPQIDGLNNKPAYKGKHLIDDHGEPIGKVGKQYVNEYERMVEKASKQAVQEVHGTSPSGMTAHLDTSGSEWKIVVKQSTAKHADEPWEDLTIFVDHDANGNITQLASVDEAVAQTALVNEFLSHHGVKGMKWGIRNKRSSKTSSKSTGSSKPQAHELSDEDLKAAIARMNLEKQYKELTNPQVKKKNQAGADFAKEIGKNLLKNTVQALGTHAVNTALKK